MGQAELIAAFYRAYNSGDAAAAVALYAGDGAHVEAASGQSRTGAAALQKGLAGFLGMFDGLRFDTQPPVRAGSKAVVTYVMHGTVNRDLGPLPARGKAVALRGVHLFEIEDGAIRRTTDFWDMDDFRAQVAA
ncbi:nuclear transport factor 2 family protein [Frigidibacter sp. MR17.24]|uniref:nuclear transport factor 2 family protein n=1 Tax=Frigidibacter sp. MR17.24 TaxID=3127345 RepID=UPI003012B86A